MRIESLPRATELLEGTTLLIDEELCLNLRGRVMSCTACGDQCPVDALTLTPDAIELNDELCTGCGACLPVCPSGTLRLTGFSPARFLQSFASEEEVHLHCSASQDGGGGVVIPCHQVLDARLLAAAMADGTRDFVLHGLSACANCPKGDAGGHVQQLEEALQQWFAEEAPGIQHADPGETVAQGERKREDQPHMSRRGFLRFAGARATLGTAAWLLPIPEEEDNEEASLPFYQGEGAVTRVVDYQRLLAERVTRLPWADDAELPWRPRALTEACSACLACGQRCPTGAFVALEDGLGREISFEPALCTDCGLCEQVCPEQAIQVTNTSDPAEIAGPRDVKMRRLMRPCGKCKHPFLPDETSVDLCPICQNENDLDEEWLSMLER